MFNAKLRRLLGYMWRYFRSDRGLPLLKKIYTVIFLPIFDYCLPIWSSAADTHLETIISAHKRLLKLILGVPAFQHGYSYEELAEMASMPTLTQRSRYLSMGLAYNQISSVPYDKCTEISLLNRTRTLRRNRLYNIPFKRLVNSQRTFSVCVPTLLNSANIN